MNHKEVFKAFCEKEKSLPLFLSYDWLNTVAPNNWNVILEQRGEEIVGAFPYILNKRKGFSFIEQPALTAYGGVWIKYPEGQKYTSSLSYEKEVYSNLIPKLPQFDSFSQKFHPSFHNWLPFYWKGFQETTYYTYIIKDLEDTEKAFQDFKENIRREIRKAEKTIHIETSSNIELLFDLKVKSNKVAGLKTNTSLQNLKNIHALCQQKNIGELLIASEGNQVHCTALFVWDQNTCYYLYGAVDPEFKTSGAISLMLWEAIKKYSSHVKEFNFEGSMIEEIERYFRAFGATQAPYHLIRKVDSKILKTKEFIKGLF